MTEPYPGEPQDAYPSGPEGPVYESELGIIEALGMGWRLLTADLWALWVPVFVAWIVYFGAAMIGGMIPYLNFCIGLGLSIFLQPPLMAGAIRVAGLRIDGVRPDVGQVFDAFRYRYWQSVVAWLPVNLAYIAVMIVLGLVVAGTMGGMGLFRGQELSDEEALLLMGIIFGVFIPAMLAYFVFSLFFVLAPVTVWDYPESGWEAAKASARLVRERFWSVLGLALLCMLLVFAAVLAGCVALCVGIFFTSPLVMAWFAGTWVYLYRSWTGQPLEQEPRTYEELVGIEGHGEEPWPPEGEGQGPSRTPPGPVPPSDVYPPERG